MHAEARRPYHPNGGPLRRQLGVSFLLVEPSRPSMHRLEPRAARAKNVHVSNKGFSRAGQARAESPREPRVSTARIGPCKGAAPRMVQPHAAGTTTPSTHPLAAADANSKRDGRMLPRPPPGQILRPNHKDTHQAPSPPRGVLPGKPYASPAPLPRPRSLGSGVAAERGPTQGGPSCGFGNAAGLGSAGETSRAPPANPGSREMPSHAEPQTERWPVSCRFPPGPAGTRVGRTRPPTPGPGTGPRPSASGPDSRPLEPTRTSRARRRKPQDSGTLEANPDATAPRKLRQHAPAEPEASRDPGPWTMVAFRRRGGRTRNAPPSGWPASGLGLQGRLLEGATW